MKRWLCSLQTRLTVSVILLVALVSLLTFFYTYRQATSALKKSAREELQSLVAAMATQINGDIAASLKPGDETSARYAALRAQLKKMQSSNPDLKYVYIMRKNGDKVEFAIDPEYGNPADPGAAIGEEYANATQDLLDGFSRPTADKEFYTDKWGTFLSGYAPVMDSKGDAAGIVGIDMTSGKFLEKQRFVKRTIYYVMGGGVLLAALVILFFSKTIIRDIQKLNKTAQAVSRGDTGVDVGLSRCDEIGELAESLSRMKSSLLKAKEEVEKASLEKSKFFAYANHELRSPLHSVIASSEMLQDGIFGELNAKQREYVGNITAGGQHLLRLINNLLDLSKIEAGRMEFHPAPCSVKLIAAAAAGMLGDALSKTGVTLEVPDALPETERITADELKLKEIIINLLSNAAKFSPRGGKITLGLAKTALEDIRTLNSAAADELAAANGAGAAYIKINVQDSGPGIKPEDIGKLFQPFAQMESPAQAEGTGLGLVITKHFVRLHKGVIWVDSRPGEGANFIVVIPAR